ncbi:hypothetical protein, partial [Pseudomonas helleri]|uniref:hypothetical protein n=1 Tax=Pseudomonas helleri TaxID=1608996 RepID=UPI003FD0D2D9
LFIGGDKIVQKGRTDSSVKTYLSDLKIQDNKIILLINRSDPNAPDAVSSDPDNKSRLVHAKPPGHGGDYSAHVVLTLDPVKGDNYYLCVIETVFGSGLHASSISKYIKHLFRACKKQFKTKYMIPNINGAKTAQGKPLMVHLLHEIEFQGHPSIEFEKDLNGGTLSSIQLLNFSKEGAVWDDKGVIKEKVRLVELRPDKALITSVKTSINQVRNLIIRNKEEYKQLRLKFKNEDGEARDATISADSGKLVDESTYIKRHVITAPLVNTNSFEKANSFIIKEVLTLME